MASATSLCYSSLILTRTTNNKNNKPTKKIPVLKCTSASSSSNTTPRPAPIALPLKKIPGDYGLPLIGPIKDRQDYFYNQGREEFFKSRIQKYQSTVYRVNMPPGPPISPNPNVVALLDGKSFPTLFDTSKVDKTDLFTGTFMPSTDLTGGYRVLSYLDPSDPHHAPLKTLMFKLVSFTRHRVISEFRSSFSDLFSELAANESNNRAGGGRIKQQSWGRGEVGWDELGREGDERED